MAKVVVFDEEARQGSSRASTPWPSRFASRSPLEWSIGWVWTSGRCEQRFLVLPRRTASLISTM
jgi:hypothetical protein